MNWLIWTYAFFLFIGSMAMVILGVLSIQRRRNRIVIFFALTCFSSSIYAFGYAMEITRVVPELIKLWSRFEYTGMPFISAFLFLFVLHFVKSGRRVSRLSIIVPLLISFAILMIRQTNHLHGLYYSSYAFESHDGYMLMTFGKGPWYWFFAGFNILAILSSSVLIVVYIFRSSRLFRKQGGLLFLGTFVPIVPYIIHVTGIFHLAVDIIPAAMTLSTTLFFVAVVRYRLFYLIPAGRDWMVETMTDALVVLTRQKLVVDANPSALRVFGTDGVDPIGRVVTEVMPLLDPELEPGKRIKMDNKVWEVNRTVLPSRRGSLEGVLLVAHDVTDLERLAREDMLTGLLNRHSWNDAADTELSRLTRHSRYGSVIFLDLDYFKKVNDTYGHAAGDAVLKELGQILKAGVRRPDLVGRYGGEEFVLFLPESDTQGAAEVAERLRADLEAAVVEIGEEKIKITGSFGVAGSLVTMGLSLETLVNQADKALYEAKHTGRNTVSLYS